MNPDAGITGSVQPLARNGRLTYAWITSRCPSIARYAALYPLVRYAATSLSASSEASPGTVYHRGYLPDGNGS
jgi:hypothetical protein